MLGFSSPTREQMVERLNIIITIKHLRHSKIFKNFLFCLFQYRPTTTKKHFCLQQIKRLANSLEQILQLFPYVFFFAINQIFRVIPYKYVYLEGHE